MAGDEGTLASAARNKALVHRFMDEFWDRGDLGLADALFAPDEAAWVKGWASRLRAAMPDLRVTVDFCVAQGDLVAVYYTLRGTHTGAATGRFVDLIAPTGRIEPTGNPIEITSSFLFRVAGGGLTLLRRVGDTFGLFQQMGALPRAD